MTTKTISSGNLDKAPEVLIANYIGKHNTDLDFSRNRLDSINSAKDLSTICIIPTNGLLPSKVAERHLMLINPMNQKIVRFPVIGKEKSSLLNNTIETILATPTFDSFKYFMITEDQTIPPIDAFVKLLENVEKYDVVGGLTFEPGVGGRPMIYGSPYDMPLNFLPHSPMPEAIQECLAVGYGFTIFKLDIFRDKRVPKPWFRTPPNSDPDFYFFENIHKLGYKVACDTRVRVGTYDITNDIVW